MSKGLLDYIRDHEGFRAKPYRDSLGNLTIGYGTNLDAGITKIQAEWLMRLHVQTSRDWLLQRYEWFRGLSLQREYALIEMHYQLGSGTFVKFRKMLRALREGKWDKAADEMLDSRWAKQTPVRAQHCAKLMREG